MISEDFSEDRESKVNSWLMSQFGHEFFQMNKVERSFKERSMQFEKFKKEYRERGIKIISIAGTNGKGETAHTLSQLLKGQGRKVALWTSPHIMSLRERFRVDEKDISYDDLEAVLKRGAIETEGMSYYEFLFYCFHLYVLGQKEVDTLVLEVGLGGRLDSVNYFDADIMGLTSISRDHCEILGTNLKGILKEKLGITRKDKPLISNLDSSYLRHFLKDYCCIERIPLLSLGESYNSNEQSPYFIRNRFLALALADYITEGKLPGPERKKQLLEGAWKLPLGLAKGRFEKMTLGDKSFIFMGAHNIDGFKKMTEALLVLKDKGLLELPFQNILFSFSKRPLKDVKYCLSILESAPCLSEKFCLSFFKHPKAMSEQDLVTVFEGIEKKEIWELVSDWKKLLDECSKSNNILVTGSYYFIGEVQKYLRSCS